MNCAKCGRELREYATDRHAFAGLTIETMIIVFTIACSILLIKNKNRVAKVNGIITYRFCSRKLIYWSVKRNEYYGKKQPEKRNIRNT